MVVVRASRVALVCHDVDATRTVREVRPAYALDRYVRRLELTGSRPSALTGEWTTYQHLASGLDVGHRSVA